MTKNILHVSFQRNYFNCISYRHHAVLVLRREENEPKTFLQYEVGLGGYSQAKTYKVFSSFQRTEKQIKDISKFDFEKGVYVCVYGKRNYRNRQPGYESVKKRADDCVEKYLLPFWSPMSPICETFATKIMTNCVSRRQIKKRGLTMRLSKDTLDPVSFFEQLVYIVLFHVMSPWTTLPYLSLIPEIFFLYKLAEREEYRNAWQSKKKNRSSRNVFKYVWSFLFRWTIILTFCSSSIGKILACLIIPLVIGAFYDYFLV